MGTGAMSWTWRWSARALIVLVLATGAAGGEPDFDADLAACHRLTKDDRWQSAQKAYGELFEKYRQDPRVVTQLPAIEDDLKLLQFRKGRERPRGPALFGPEVVKFNADTQDIELVFADYLQAALWKGSAGKGHRVLDLRFDKDVAVEVPAEGYKRNGPNVTATALLCWNPETRGGYFAGNGIGNENRSSDPNDCAIFKLAGPEPEKLAHDCTYPVSGWSSDIRFVRIARKNGAIRIDVDQRLGCRAEDPTFSGGFLALSVQGTTSVRVKGKLDALWYRQQLASFEDKAFRDWVEKGYDRCAALPEWLRDAPTSHANAPGAPSDATPSVEMQLGALARKVLCADTEVAAADLVPSADLPERSSLFASGLGSLAMHDAAAAREALTRLVELEPGFAWGHVALARALFELRELDLAREQLASARSVDATIPAIYEGLALIEFVSGDLVAARAALDEAIRACAADEGVQQMTRLVSRAVTGPSWSKAYHYKSTHFDVRSDHSQQMCNDVATRLEASLREYMLKFRAVKGQKGCARVDVFSSRDSYVAYAGEVGMDLTKTLGAYVPKLRELVVWYPADRVEFWQTVKHEAFHQFVHNFAEDLPLWFNEGYAEYFGKGALDATPAAAGGDRSDITAFLKKKRAEIVPLERFLRTSRREFMANAGLHYAEAWAFVSFLRSMKDGDLKSALDRYFDALVAGSPSDRAFQAVLEPLLPRLQAGFDQYLTANL